MAGVNTFGFSGHCGVTVGTVGLDIVAERTQHLHVVVFVGSPSGKGNPVIEIPIIVNWDWAGAFLTVAVGASEEPGAL